jgi:hypothetical protein
LNKNKTTKQYKNNKQQINKQTNTNKQTGMYQLQEHLQQADVFNAVKKLEGTKSQRLKGK